MNIRQGIDITSVKRIEKAIKRRGSRFTNRLFTRAERAYCESKRMKYEHYAARFAAKEAAMKAFEISRENRCRYQEIEVKRRPSGKPTIYLSPTSRKRFGLPVSYQGKAFDGPRAGVRDRDRSFSGLLETESQLRG